MLTTISFPYTENILSLYNTHTLPALYHENIALLAGAKLKGGLGGVSNPPNAELCRAKREFAGQNEINIYSLEKI